MSVLTEHVPAFSHFPLFWQLCLDLPYHSGWHREHLTVVHPSWEWVFLDMGRLYCSWHGTFFLFCWGFYIQSIFFFNILMFPLAVADSNPEPLRRWFFQHLTLSQVQQGLVTAVVSLILSNPKCSCQHSHLTRVILRNTKLTLNILM